MQLICRMGLIFYWIRARIQSLHGNECKLMCCLGEGVVEMSFSLSFKFLLTVYSSWPLQEELYLDNVSLLLQQMGRKVNELISL